jgi:putative DNA primase/helicase
VLAKFAARLQQLKVRENVLSGARVESDMAISSSMFDARQDLLNFRNGTYDLGKDTFRDHRREDYQTIVLPYDFDRAAKSSLWERVIADVWPDADTQCFVQRWIGYCLSGSVKEQKFLVLWGRGANGKSVVVKTTLRALGGYARQVGSDVFATSMKDDDDRARKIVPLRGKRLVSTTETKQGQSLDEEMIKSIASPDTQESRLLYCERETWEPTAKVVIMGNHKMRTRGGDYATDRRIILLGCEQRFEGDHCDPDLVDKLAAELPGIINWAIEGHRQWKQHGLGAPTKVQADTREYCGENDVLAPFFEDLCAADSDLFVLRASLYQAFAAWSRGQGNDHPMSSRSFAERVQERGFRPGDKRSVGADRDRTWIGIALRSGQGSGHMGTSGQGNGILFPVLITEKVSGISAQKCPVPTTVALDPLVTLAHCLRAKPDTAASDEDRQALAKHFRGLNGTAEAAGERLWNYWRAAPTPSVTDFLAHEPKAKGGAA